MNTESFISTSSIQTKKLGALLAEELRGGEIICLSGDLGSGKTTFTQGLLKGLGVNGPYTSPTFNILKEYKFKINKNTRYKIQDTKYKIYHIDAYRINSKDLFNLGWKDFAGKADSIVIIEWAERVKKIIPTKAVWIKFVWLNDKERKITLGNI
jgi:tRNA threonylcarbamoyladenosine biosynthesis protein TsaE